MVLLFVAQAMSETGGHYIKLFRPITVFTNVREIQSKTNRSRWVLFKSMRFYEYYETHVNVHQNLQKFTSLL